jgi:hypothetical protein
VKALLQRLEARGVRKRQSIWRRKEQEKSHVGVSDPRQDTE